jgi:hypothetical protein
MKDSNPLSVRVYSILITLFLFPACQVPWHALPVQCRELSRLRETRDRENHQLKEKTDEQDKQRQ